MGIEYVRYDKEAEPCAHCGSHWTHFTEYHGSYDCHCEFCGRVFKSRERQHDEFDKQVTAPKEEADR